MEERIIDDEYGRGVRLRKTKDGYVDVTDELADENADGEESIAAEEIAIEFPDFEEYEDEDLIGLDPAEVERRRQEKAAEDARRRAEYERYCAEGDEFLAAESFKAAAQKYEKAYELDENPKEAALGLWRAKTENFTQPDVLAEEYAEVGVETMEYDLGEETLQTLKQQYGDVFRGRIDALTEEETPLAEEVEVKQVKRRAYLKDRLKKATIKFAISAVPMLTALILAIVFGLKINSTPTDTYVLPTIICGVAWAVFFVVFAVFTNKFINAFRMRKQNENLSSTGAGMRLLTIRNYKTLYAYILNSGETADTATAENQESINA